LETDGRDAGAVEGGELTAVSKKRADIRSALFGFVLFTPSLD
jgi:hypothetical protein